LKQVNFKKTYALNEPVVFENKHDEADTFLSVLTPTLFGHFSMSVPEVGAFPRARVVEPLCNISKNSIRLNVLEPEKNKIIFPAFVSFTLHVLLIAGFLAFENFRQSHLIPETVEPMEIAWGLDVLPAQGGQTEVSETGNSQEVSEATKDKQLLPQLPKLIEVESASPKEIEEIPKPNEKQAPDKKIVTEENPKKEDEKKSPVIKKEESNNKKISAKEMLERIEKEKRKADEKTAKGSKESKASEGKKALPSDLPPAPVANAIGKGSGINSAGGEFSAGDPNSQNKLSGPDEEYRAVLRNHVLRSWSVSSVAEFDEALKVQVEVVLNPFGRLTKPPKVVKSSGNDNFDEQALEAVKGSEPFPEPSEGIKMRRIILNLQSPSSQRN
jgi:TonB family protein